MPRINVTPELLVALGAREAKARAYAPIFNEVWNEFGLTTPLRVAHFIGQICAETGDARSGAILIHEREVWEGGPSGGNRYQVTYRNRLGNRSVADGYNYRGGGLIQVTGRDNYAVCYRWLRERLGERAPNILANPDLTGQPRVSALVSMWYWSTSGGRECSRVRPYRGNDSCGNLNEIADRGIERAVVRAVSSCVNSCTREPLHLVYRVQHAQRAFRILSQEWARAFVDDTPPTRPGRPRPYYRRMSMGGGLLPVQALAGAVAVNVFTRPSAVLGKSEPVVKLLNAVPYAADDALTGLIASLKGVPKPPGFGKPPGWETGDYDPYVPAPDTIPELP